MRKRLIREFLATRYAPLAREGVEIYSPAKASALFRGYCSSSSSGGGCGSSSGDGDGSTESVDETGVVDNIAWWDKLAASTSTSSTLREAVVIGVLGGNATGDDDDDFHRRLRDGSARKSWNGAGRELQRAWNDECDARTEGKLNDVFLMLCILELRLIFPRQFRDSSET